MVKFEEALRQQIVSKWEKKYINYSLLKDYISPASVVELLTVKSQQDGKEEEKNTILTPRYEEKEGEKNNLLTPKYDRKEEGEVMEDLLTEREGLINRTLNKKKIVEPPTPATPTPIDDRFAKLFEFELNKVENFFQERKTEFFEHFKYLEKSCQGERRKSKGGSIGSLEGGDDEASLTKDSLIRALTDLYRDFNCLKSFAVINYTGFIKILKKNQKVTSNEDLSKLLNFKLERMDFTKESSLNDIINRMERVFADTFCDGNVGVARATLLTKKGPSTNWELFRIGLHSGVCFALVIWLMWDCLVDNDDATLWTDVYLYVYQGVFFLILAIWLWGINLYLWDDYRINYMFIFEFDPRYSFHFIKVFTQAMEMSAVACINFLLYFKTRRKDLTQYFNVNYWPLTLFVYCILKLLFPISERSNFLRIMKNVIISPFGVVRFAEFYAAEMCTSLVFVFNAFAFGFCYFSTGEFLQSPSYTSDSPCKSSFIYSRVVTPILICLPFLWRFLQCCRRYYESRLRFPHLTNALKYSITIFFILIATFQPEEDKINKDSFDFFQIIYIFAFVVTSIYSFTWDIFIDWGLGRSRTNFGLRHTLMFSNRLRGSLYFVAVILNLTLRFSWTLTIIPWNAADPFKFSDNSLYKYIFPYICLLEILRRSLWGLFRLENEHVNNSEGYRKVDFIPLHFDTTNTVKKAVDDKKKLSRSKSITFEIFAIILFISILIGIIIYNNY